MTDNDKIRILAQAMMILIANTDADLAADLSGDGPQPKQMVHPEMTMALAKIAEGKA